MSVNSTQDGDGETATPDGNTPPYTFAFLHNDDSISHSFTFTVTRTASQSVVYETSTEIKPDEIVEITDEWLTESGEYRVRGKTGAGNSVSTRIDAESNWACDHFMEFTIREDGEVDVGRAVGSGKMGCEVTATPTPR